MLVYECYQFGGYRKCQRVVATLTTGCGDRSKGGTALVLDDQGGGIISVGHDIAPTLRAEAHGHPPCIIEMGALLRRGGARIWNDKCHTLRADMGDNHPLVMETYCLQGSMIGRAEKNGPRGSGIAKDVCFTLNTIDRHAVAECEENTDELCDTRKPSKR